MKFSIGYNHDIKLLNLLDVYKDNIEAFYFPIPRQYLSTSRHIRQKSGYPKEIYKIIDKCNSLGINSQLVLNATCDGSSAFEKAHFLKTIGYIRKLVNAGLKSVIVANPVYMRKIREAIKGVQIEASVNCYVKNVEHALYLRDLGVDVLNIDNDINRDIPLIKKIKAKTGLKIKVLLTEACLKNCAFEKTHWNFIAHRDMDSKAEMLPDIEQWGLDFFSKNPSRIFRSSFIPPEGLRYYTSFADYFKIGTRDTPTDAIELRLKAFINQKYDGNLINLLDCTCYQGFYSYIDSKALRKANFFRKMLTCGDNCEKCNFCKKLAEKAIVTNSYFLDSTHPVRIKESEKAVKIYNRILKRSPLDIDIYLNLTRAYLILKRYTEAINTANKAVELNPKEAEFYLLLGSLYEEAGSSDKALKIYKRAQRIFPNVGNIYLGLGRSCFNLKNNKEAIKNIKKAIELGCRVPTVYYILGSCYYRIKEYKKAVEELKKEEKISPKDAQVNFLLTKCYRNLGRIKESNKELKKGILKSRKTQL